MSTVVFDEEGLHTLAERILYEVDYNLNNNVDYDMTLEGIKYHLMDYIRRSKE